MIRIEQLLHGYENGHRLLAGSVFLKNNADMDIIATLSDWSEYVAPGGGDSSYVTAYPLIESGYYVIAKTWYANEMKRPGCVWTHSLLIPFDEVNSFSDFKQISSLFLRPSLRRSFEEYSHTIEYDYEDFSFEEYKALSVDRSMAKQIFSTFLYGAKQTVSIKAMNNNQTAEFLLLGIMNELPMEMLRNVSWCTGSAYLRMMAGRPLTCQFLSNDVMTRNVDYHHKEQKWETYVIDGLMSGDVFQGLLVRLFAEDIGDDADNYIAIVSILYTLQNYFKTDNNNEERYKEALNIITQSFPSKDQGVFVKKSFTNKRFSDKFCDDITFFYYFGTLPMDGVFGDIENMVNKRLNIFLEENQANYISLLSLICKSGDVNKWGKKILKESADILTIDEVTGVIQQNFHLFSTISLLNPDILNKVHWLELSPKEIQSILPMILDRRTKCGFSNWEQLFSALLEKNIEISDLLAKELFAKTSKATTILLDYVNMDAVRFVNYSLSIQLIDRTEDLLNWLSSVDVITDNVAYAIVKSVDVHSNIVSLRGAKIWKPFLGLQYHNLRIEVYTYLFSLSFNWPSDEDALELMHMAFYPLYTLQASGELGYSYWSSIATYLDTLMIWEDWDKCKKLRKTVVNRLKRAGKDKSVLNGYTPDRKLNTLLRNMW